MLRFTCLFLFSCSVALGFAGPRYNSTNYFLVYQWKVHTAEVYGAGTDSQMRFDFGWRNATNHLIWWTEKMDWQYPRQDAFERGVVNKFHAIYKDERFAYAESRCVAETGSFEEYQSCLTRPNIMFVELSPLTPGFFELFDMGGWKMSLLELETTLNYWRNGEWANAVYTESKFINSPRSEDGWTMREGHYNLKMAVKRDYEHMRYGAPMTYSRF